MIESQGADWTRAHIGEALESGDLSPEDFSIRELAEELIGHEYVRSCGPGKGGGFLSVTEDADAVSSGHFANITGQIVYSKILAAATAEAFVFSKIIPTIPTQFSGEKIPGITGLGDAAIVVKEGELYSHAGVNEDWIQTPATVKRGTIVPVTKEVVFFDRTGLMLDRCSKVGEAIGINKEKRIIDVVVDENTTAGRYNWKGNEIATYGDNSGTHNWDNLSASTALVDYTDIEACELLMAALTDPHTGEPMTMFADSVIVTPQLAGTAYRILHTIHVDVAPVGFDVDSVASVSRFPSPLGRTSYSPSYRIITSRLLAARMGTDTSWYLGAPSKAFAYMENWPITVTQAPPNNHEEFNRDIVAQYKASEYGATTTLEPRHMVKATA